MNTALIVAAVLCIILFNTMATRMVSSSSLVTTRTKNAYFALIWLVPVLGFFVATWLFSNQMKKAKKNRDKELVTALNEFARKVNTINKDIKQQRQDKHLH